MYICEIQKTIRKLIPVVSLGGNYFYLMIIILNKKYTLSSQWQTSADCGRLLIQVKWHHGILENELNINFIF